MKRNLALLLAATLTITLVQPVFAGGGISFGGRSFRGLPSVPGIKFQVPKVSKPVGGPSHSTLPYYPPRRVPTKPPVTILPVNPIHRVTPVRPVCPTPPPAPCPTPAPRPIIVEPLQPAPQPKTPLEQARLKVAEAKRAFARQELAPALKLINEANALAPKTADIHQFRSLIYFAARRHKLAAADAYDALLLGPTWNWKTIQTLYGGDTAPYLRELRGLEKVARDNPSSLNAQFLLGYHYLVLGHWEAGEKQLAKVLEIQPNEPLTSKLIQVVRNVRTSGDVAQAARR